MSYIDAQRLKHVRAAVKLVAPKDWRYKVTAEHGGVAVITIYATPHPLGEFFAPHKAKWLLPGTVIPGNLGEDDAQPFRDLITEQRSMVEIAFITNAEQFAPRFKEKMLDIIFAMHTVRDTSPGHDVCIRFGDYDQAYKQEVKSE